MSKQDVIELKWIIKEIKEMRQETLNDPHAQASKCVTNLMQAFDTLLYKIEEKSKDVA